MTDAQIARNVKLHLGEYFHAYAIVGIRTDNHVPLIINNMPHVEAAICINSVMAGCLGQGGFSINTDGENPQE